VSVSVFYGIALNAEYGVGRMTAQAGDNLSGSNAGIGEHYTRDIPLLQIGAPHTLTLLPQGYLINTSGWWALPTSLKFSSIRLKPIKPHPDSEVEFWHVGNLTACGTSPSQGYRVHTSRMKAQNPAFGPLRPPILGGT